MLFLLYDSILGISGTLTTWTATRDFPHKYVRNERGESGTLSKRAIVTYSEMKEHLFYQLLNLVQAWYLHMIVFFLRRDDDDDEGGGGGVMTKKVLLLWFVTSPWHFRRCYFPVNSFSANWSHGVEREENVMYRVKKWQYVFYKHVVLHGLNISLIHPSLSSKRHLVMLPSWRVFWVCLNSAYVLEFFLQSLVKKGVMTQRYMICLQCFLMVVSSLAAANAVFEVVRPFVVLLSLFLNFTNRKWDVFNTLLVGFVSLVL